MARSRRQESDERHYCGECAYCTEVWELFHLLSIDGKPTLGTCPYQTRRKVLLSEKSCEHFKKRIT